MKHYLLAAGLVLTGNWCSAQVLSATATQQTGSVKSAGNMLHVTSTVHDFGKIPQGKPVYHVFRIENRSADTLRIEHVQSSCGCTTPSYQKEPIAPGNSTELKVGYNAEATGLFDKNITVYYNGGRTQSLYIRGNVWQTPQQSVPENALLNVFKQFP